MQRGPLNGKLGQEAVQLEVAADGRLRGGPADGARPRTTAACPRAPDRTPSRTTSLTYFDSRTNRTQTTSAALESGGALGAGGEAFTIEGEQRGDRLRFRQRYAAPDGRLVGMPQLRRHSPGASR